MANRLQRVLAMDEAVKARNAPKAGVQEIVNADGSVTKIPYMEDRRGRRTVMTREGEKVLPGFEGRRSPYEKLGGGLRNVIGGLFGKTSPPYLPPKTDYFDMSQLGPKPKTAITPYKTGTGEVIFQEQVTDSQGNITTRFLDRAGSVIADPSDAKQMQIAEESVREQEIADPDFVGPRRPENLDDLRAAEERATRSQTLFGATPKKLTLQEEKIEAFMPRGVSLTGNPGTRKPTKGEMQSAIASLAKGSAKPEKQDPDYDAALFLSEENREKYISGNLSADEFKRLHARAMTAMARDKKENPKKTEGVMKSGTAYTQMTLAMPNIQKYEEDPDLMSRIAGFSGWMAKNFRSTADPDERAYLQAADAWIRAKLRKESGATIGDKEMEQEYATFFPQLNDTPELIKEKARQRNRLTRQMGIDAGVIDSTDTPKTPEADLSPLVVGTIEIVEVP